MIDRAISPRPYIRQLVLYAHVVFYLFPLVLFGASQTIAESLVVNVLTYSTAYLPLLEDDRLLTCIFATYAVFAGVVASSSDTSFTEGMLGRQLQSVFFKPGYITSCCMIIETIKSRHCMFFTF